MATVAKDFKIKNGLIVEGSTGTINNYDILTKSAADTTYIQGLVGGVANSEAVANAIVLRDANASFAANVITADLTGDVTGTVSDISNHDTDDLSEGTSNKYFTDQRAQDALAGMYDPAGSASSAQSAAESYADGVAADAYNNATSYTDTAVANLVDSAPALLDTLNELAAAIGDDANFATTVTNLVAEKQNTLTAGSNIDITGNTISVTGVDLAGAADTAYNNAVSYADSLASNYDAAGSADTAYNNAVAYADALDTDDIEEGLNNLYHTDQRAVDAVNNAISGGVQTNISVSYNGGTGKFDFVAENGVADSDTDDLVEGTSNLYFTNARAVSALEGVTPDFPAVEIASVAKQVAAEASVPTASTNTAVSWAKADYRSAELLVKIASGSHTEVSKVILTLDTSDNIAITEYAMVGTNGALGSVSADVSGNDVRLRVTTDNNNSTVAVVGTLLK
jgi:hypothetical protein